MRIKPMSFICMWLDYIPEILYRILKHYNCMRQFFCMLIVKLYQIIRTLIILIPKNMPRNQTSEFTHRTIKQALRLCNFWKC